MMGSISGGPYNTCIVRMANGKPVVEEVRDLDWPSCAWCERDFTAMEARNFRNVGAINIPYHPRCLRAWLKNERLLERILGEVA